MKTKQMVEYLSNVENQVLADMSDASRVQRVTTQVVMLMQLYGSIVCAGKVQGELQGQIDAVLARICGHVGLDFAKEKSIATESCAQSREPATKATPTIEMPPFDEMVRPWFLQQEYDEAEAAAARLVETIEEAEKVPANWTKTKKEWQEKQRSYVEKLRESRDSYRKLATRYKNDALTSEEYPREVRDLEDKIERARTKQGGKLTPEQRETRLQYLLGKIFADEDAGADLDFFPTPDDIIERYLFDANAELISELPAMAKVLEPSAGRGNIADMIRKRMPKADVDVVELSDIRREVLYHKGYNVIGTDFMEVGVVSRDDRGRAVISDEYRAKYDAVFMNPPFLKGYGREHVKRALDMVKIDGVLVAVMPTGWIDGSAQENTFFQDHVRQRGDVDFTVIKESEYNVSHSRKITIDIAIVTIVKRREVAEIDAAEAQRSHSEAAKKIVSKWTSERIDIPSGGAEVDTGFVPPEIIVARPEITEKAAVDYIPASLRARYDFVKDHVYEGANKAIAGLDRTGGFLLADGTGTGKTIQSLLVARHYWETTGQPVLIFTVDDRVIQGSYFADAKKLGWKTPDYIDTATSKRPNRPRNYEGLYDDVAIPTVSLYSRERGIQDGINVTTYNTLSNWKGLESVKQAKELAERAHEELVKEYRQKIARFVEVLDRKYPKKNNKRTKDKGEEGYKKELEAYKDQMREELDNHPATRELYLAKQALMDSILASMREFMKTAQLVIFDEAHKVKNAGDGLDLDAMSIRAQLALGIINQVPRVLYMTATPADRPFDILYLKKLGFWRDEKEYRQGMYSIGYSWTEPEKNKAGDVIRPGRWIKSSSQTALDVSRSNGEMRRLFTLATEEGNMIRREIQLTNLSVKIHKFPAPQSALDMLEAVKDKYTENINGRIVIDYNAMTMVQMQELERYKIDKALELIDAAVMAGKQVVTFCYTVEEEEVERKKEKTTKAGTVEVLKNILAKRYGEDKVGVLVGTDNEYENFRRLENVQNFQNGKVRVLVGTITSGGTGVNLDDTTGRNPREMVVITPPLSFINVMQGVGRIVRANTKSRSTAHFIFTDNTPVDTWLSQLLATKFETLSATVEGESGRLSLSQAEETQDTGSQGVINLIVSNENKDKVVVRKHPLRVKKNFRHNGWEMTNNTPYYVTVDGTPKNSTLIIGARTRADLDTLKEQYGDLIERLELKPNINRNFQRYNGPHFGRWFKERDETYMSVLDELLNIIDPRLESTFASKQQFSVGDEVIVGEAIDWAGLPTGTVVRIAAVRPRLTEQDLWRYDIEHEGEIKKAVSGSMLRASAQMEAAAEIYPVGTRILLQAERYYYPKDELGRPMYYRGYRAIIQRTATIVSKGRQTVGVDVEEKVMAAPTKAPTETNQITYEIDVLDFSKRLEIGFEEFSVDEKTGLERTWQNNYELVKVEMPNETTPGYKMVADRVRGNAEKEQWDLSPEMNAVYSAWQGRLDLDYYLEASRRNLMQTSRTAKGVVDVSASKGKAEKIVQGLTSERAASLSQDNYEKAVRYLWTIRNKRFETPAEITELCDKVNQIVTAGVVKEGELLRTDDSEKYPYILAKDIDKAREDFSKDFMQALKQFDTQVWTDLAYPTMAVRFAAWVEWRVNLVDHVYADGVGKTSKALAAYVLMRLGMPLPEYRDNKEFFSYAPKTRPNKSGGAIHWTLPTYYPYAPEGFWTYVNYYYSLMPAAPSGKTSSIDRVCQLQGKLGQLEAMYRKWIANNGYRFAKGGDMAGLPQEIESAIARINKKLSGLGGSMQCDSCPPKTSTGKPCITKECLDVLESACETGVQTWSVEAGTMSNSKIIDTPKGWYSDKTGYPTRERYAIHRRIIDKLRDTTVCAASLTTKPIAVLTGGAPGSGKSSFIREEAPWLLDPEKFMHIDADAMREKLPEYQGWNATLTHEEASTLVKIALKEIAQPCKRNVLYDGTMNNLKKYNELIDTFEDLGYDVYIIYMEIPQGISESRVLKRYEESGRYVPRYVIEDFYKKAGDRGPFDALKERVKGWVLVNGMNREVLKRGGERIPTIDAENGKKVKRQSEQTNTEGPAELDLVPPKDVQEAAARGLELRREHGRGGTEVGVARARDLSNGRRLSMETVKRMRSYFARHDVDKKGKDWGNKSNPSAGYIAWLLWGGDPGREWVEGIHRALVIEDIIDRHIEKRREYDRSSKLAQIAVSRQEKDRLIKSHLDEMTPGWSIVGRARVSVTALNIMHDPENRDAYLRETRAENYLGSYQSKKAIEGMPWPDKIQAEKKKTEPEIGASTDVVVKKLPITAIYTDTKRFQPRSGLSEEKVMAIVNNFDPRKFDPIVVWKQGGKYYVLAGHHRLAAAERLGMDSVPVREYEGTEAEAITYAWTSNIMTRTQSNVENAGYLRKLRSNGVTEAAIKRTCNEFYSKDCRTVFALSYLPDDAIILQDMAAFTPASDEYKELETMARWIGVVIEGQTLTLTNGQINELYRYLRRNFRLSGKRFRSANEFSEHIEKALATRFPFGQNDGGPLNLDNLRPRTDTERAFDQREQEITDELANEKRYIDDQRAKLLRVEELRASGKSATAEPILDSMRKAEQRIVALQRELVDLREKRADAVSKAVESWPALFGLR
ncbi:MAG: hypothetical protein FGM22_07285 [Burkholderiaceae bacterium]|nr:hypothetical protein [Burkholderiaceae bacterium]